MYIVYSILYGVYKIYSIETVVLGLATLNTNSVCDIKNSFEGIGFKSNFQ